MGNKIVALSIFYILSMIQAAKITLRAWTSGARPSGYAVEVFQSDWWETSRGFFLTLLN